MPFREKFKAFVKSGSSDSAKLKPTPTPVSTAPPAVREKSKPYHDILDKFDFASDTERRKSSAGNVSPMGSRRGSLLSFRRLSSSFGIGKEDKEDQADGAMAKRRSSEERRRSMEKGNKAKPGPFAKPHSGDPRALEPIQSVQEPFDDSEQEPKIVRNGRLENPAVEPISEAKSNDEAEAEKGSEQTHIVNGVGELMPNEHIAPKPSVTTPTSGV